MEKKEIKISLGTFTIGIISIILLTMAVCMGIYIMNINKKQTEEINQDNSSAYENMTNVINDKNITNNSAKKDNDNEFIKEFTQKMQNIENKIYYTSDEISDEISVTENYNNLKYENDIKKLNIINGEYSYKYTDEENNVVEVIYEKKLYNSDFKGYIYLETTNNMENAYIALAFEVDDNTKLNVKTYTPYKINGISGKIKKVIIAEEGQDINGLKEKLFIIMEDGTLKYVDCIEGVKTGKFNAYNCDGLNNKIGKVKDIIKVNGHEFINGEALEGGWMDWIIENEKGEYFKWNVE